MAVEICPLAADWGNLADWAAVVVAALGAVAVFLMTKAANRTAQASHDLALQIKTSEEAAQARDMTVLIALIYGDVFEASLAYRKFADRLVEEGEFDAFVMSEESLDALQELAAGPDLSRVKNETSRFHLLPERAGEQLAMGIGCIDVCVTNVKALRMSATRDDQRACFQALIASAGNAAQAFRAAHLYLKKGLKSESDQSGHV